MKQNKALYQENYFCIDHLKADLKSRAIQSGGITIFSQLINYGIYVIGTILLARILSPIDFGLVAMVTAISLLLGNFGVNGFTEAIIQKEQINDQQISTLFWINFGISTILTILFICATPIIVSFYKEPRLKLICLAIAFSIIGSSTSTIHLALLKRNLLYYRITIIEITASFFSVITAIIISLMGGKYWALVGKNLSTVILLMVGSWTFCRWRPGRPIRNANVNSMLKYAFNTYGNFVLRYFSRNMDYVLIGWYYGSLSLGYYQKAYDFFVMAANQSTAPLTNVAIGTLSRFSLNPEEFRQYYFKTISIFTFIGMLLSCVLMIIANDFVVFVLGSQWHRAGEILTVFAPGVGIMLIYLTHVWLHLSLGTPEKLFRWSILELIITVTFFVIALQFGAIGIAAAWVASLYLLLLPGLWYAGRPIHIKISSILNVMWKFCFSAIMASSLSWFILHSFVVSSGILIHLTILTRIILSALLCLTFYLLFVILSHQTIRPIVQFLSFFLEMIPKIRSIKFILTQKI